MIREFPPDYELLAFFEAEPTVIRCLAHRWVQPALRSGRNFWCGVVEDGFEDAIVGSFCLKSAPQRVCLLEAWSWRNSNCATSKLSALLWTRDVVSGAAFNSVASARQLRVTAEATCLDSMGATWINSRDPEQTRGVSSAGDPCRRKPMAFDGGDSRRSVL